MKNPSITVVIPTYKRPEKLARAIRSVLQQDYDNFDILVVNDNIPLSKEDAATEELLQKCQRNGKVSSIHTSGAVGGGAARNYACREAKGEYLAFLDDDDVYLPGKLLEQMNFICANQLDFAYQDIEWINEKGDLVEYRKLDHATNFDKDSLLKAHILTPIAPTAVYMLSKKLFSKTEGFGEVKVGQDWFLMLRCIEADAKIGYMPGSYVRQYLHDGERLSLGSNKIDGENFLYRYKKRYFDLLSRSERRYVSFRHMAVLAFACKRSRKIVSALLFSLRAFAVAPEHFVAEVVLYFKRKAENKMTNYLNVNH